jgi:N utilization substance protein B
MSKKPSRQVLRHNARCYAMQALYQWHYTQDPIPFLLENWQAEHDFSSADKEYFELLVRGVADDLLPIQALLSLPAKREISDITPVELAVLYVATYELKHRLDIPYRVVINEALELSKEFGSEQSFKFVNGVLDKLVHELRKDELVRK